ncbi:MAG: DNA topoisomerase I [Candidatus Heimdallarchaeota archaeon]|nr:DNA topoisomerase I [Candidatus Heimdallarchaeota archaeon]
MPLIDGPYVLGIAEKPQAASRLARALDDNRKPVMKKIKGVPVYISMREGKKIVIVPAIGHLLTLSPLSKSWNYPVLDYHWIPSHITNPKARTKNFVDTFKSLSKEASEIIVMTDFDREGEVIGFLILKYLLGKNQAERMKFSTLTARDIVQAYSQRSKQLDTGFLNSGLLRHYVDWLYGINYSRALSLALKRVSNRFKTISIGRVQGPTLGAVVNLENEINIFVPIPFWTIESEVILNKEKFKPLYEKTKLDKKTEAKKVTNDCKDLVGVVTDISEEQVPMYSFPPFNLGDLQRESYKHFKFSPSKTLQIAESLYLKASISYPRTDSQKLPMTLGHKTILTKVGKQIAYSSFVTEILNRKKFKPREGKRTDAAHPAIHPTGNPPGALNSEEKKLYELIVKRYLALFGEPASISKKKIEITIKGHKFEVKGSKILKEGWIKYYKPYFSMSERTIPDVALNSKIQFFFVESKEDFSSPPRRFNESTLLNQMEQEKIGTKATRAGIIETLFDRGYIEGSVIKPTPLGISVVDVLSSHYPVLIKSDMTRELEIIMEEVQDKQSNIDEILINIKKDLSGLLKLFHENEEDIGISLYRNMLNLEKVDPVLIGKCPGCKVGDLRIIKSKKSGKRFISCSSYFDKSINCTVTFPLPNYGTIKPTDNKCKFDGLPMVEWRTGRNKRVMCVSMDCPSKANIKGEKKK